jgi:hypothetical protein
MSGTIAIAAVVPRTFIPV